MTADAFPFRQTISQGVAARKAARRKVIERPHKLERESYKALMKRTHGVENTNKLDPPALVRHHPPFEKNSHKPDTFSTRWHKIRRQPQRLPYQSKIHVKIIP